MIRRLALACLAAAASGRQEARVEPPWAVFDVVVRAAVEADDAVVVRAPTTVFPRAQANLAPRLAAPIGELRVRKGDTVAEGQSLARFESRDLAARRAEAAAALADAEASYGKVRLGALPADIERARGEAATAAAALRRARQIYERRKQLFEQGAMPERELLTSETEFAQAQTASDVAETALRLLESQSTERDLEMARSRVEQARGRLEFLDVQLSYAELRSPFAGSIWRARRSKGSRPRPSCAATAPWEFACAFRPNSAPAANRC